MIALQDFKKTSIKISLFALDPIPQNRVFRGLSFRNSTELAEVRNEEATAPRQTESSLTHTATELVKRPHSQ
jgi:hypothetical protein